MNESLTFPIVLKLWDHSNYFFFRSSWRLLLFGCIVSCSNTFGSFGAFGGEGKPGMRFLPNKVRKTLILAKHYFIPALTFVIISINIRFFKEGQWVVITIDDRIPVAMNSDIPVYGRCRDLNEQ